MSRVDLWVWTTTLSAGDIPNGQKGEMYVVEYLGISAMLITRRRRSLRLEMLLVGPTLMALYSV